MADMRSVFLAFALVVALAHSANAQPACDTLPNPVYLQVGDTQQPLMKYLGRALRDEPTDPVTLVYLTAGSCTNLAAIKADTPITVNMLYVPSTAENATWNPASSASLPCVPPGGSVVPDIVNTALFYTACDATPLPATIGKFDAANQAYVMAVPEASTQTAMTAEEAYFVFGFGQAGMVTPWDDELQMFIRTITKSTLLTWAANINVPADKWKGIAYDGSTMVVNALIGSPLPEKAIGILGAEVYDGRRDTLDILAYQAYGQYFAYFPDSTASSFDKKNVRDGHYTVWSPTQYFTKVDGGGAPLNARAGRVIDLLQGKQGNPAVTFSAIQQIVTVGLVPNCAMRVTRSFEGGELSRYTDPNLCTCSYEAMVPMGSTSCATCDGTNPCAAGTCRNGYCEEQ